MLDYRMQTFLTLCDTLSYHQAAQRLHITQPAVTQHIQFLEGAYGCKLFTYRSRRLEKTPQGRILEQYARSMGYQERDLAQKLRAGEGRDLAVGATKTIGDYVLPDRIRRYLEEPRNTLTLIVDNTEHLLAMLDDNRLDFAVVEGFFDKRRYSSRLYRKEPFVGICRKGHPFAGREIGVEELLEQTLIHREKGSGTRAILEQTLLGRNESFLHFRRDVCISSFRLILHLVAQGVGVSFVYKVLADSDPSLDQFTLRGEDIVREFNLVWPLGADIDEKIRWFFGEENFPVDKSGAALLE